MIYRVLNAAPPLAFSGPRQRAFCFETFAGITCSAGALLFCLTGCGRPSQANVELRKQVQTLQSQLDQCHVDRKQDGQMIRGLQARIPTEPTLPPDKLAKLFTAHGIGFGRLTGGANLDPNKPGDQAIQVYVYPVDQSGQPLKASGSFMVDAFDLASPDKPHIGHWDFPLEQTMKLWAGYFVLEYNYVLTCPWQTVPRHPDLTIRVTFVDELTEVPFVAEKQIRVVLPPPAATPPTKAAAR